MLERTFSSAVQSIRSWCALQKEPVFHTLIKEIIQKRHSLSSQCWNEGTFRLLKHFFSKTELLPVMHWMFTTYLMKCFQICGLPLWQGCKVASSHPAAPGTTPGGLIPWLRFFLGFSSTIRQMSGKLDHTCPRVSLTLDVIHPGH